MPTFGLANNHPMKLNFYSLSSGSSGNCYYVGNDSNGILIDAGISASAIRKSLKEENLSLQNIMGVFITHNHTDHVRGLVMLTKKYHLPVFTTWKIRESILSVYRNIPAYFFKEIGLKTTINISGLDIEAFPVSHDAPETVGFHICAGKMKITIATDLGNICEVASPYIRAANLLVIESNYDEQMLIRSRYPHFLKKRILSDNGHLGNHQASDFLAENISDQLSHICLAHLSINNNTPEIALQTMEKTFKDKGISMNGRLQIQVLRRNKPTGMISLTE